MSDAKSNGKDPAGFRAAPLLPRNDDRNGGLVFTVAVLAFLACIAVIAALAADRAARGWVVQLSSSATIQVRPSGGETGAEAAARAAETASAVKGVVEARALDRKASEALLEPWLGKGNIPEDLPLPYLVTVELDPKTPASAASLNQALSRARIDASVDDHSRWMEDVRRSGDLVRGAAAIACALIASAAGSMIAFATRQGLAARRDVVEVLHLCGAEDSFIANLFMTRFSLLAFQASAYGAAAAAVAGAALRLFGGSNGFTPALPIGWIDLASCVAAPILGAAVAAISAKSVATTILRAQP